MPMRTVLVVEDHSDTRRWLAGLVTEAFSDLQITEATTFDQAQNHLARGRFDLVLLDIGLPDGSGLDLVGPVLAENPKAICIMTTIYDDDDHVFSALRAGAHGYLLKEQPRDRLLEQLRNIDRGDPPLTASIARRILRHFRDDQAVEEPSEPLVALTKREQDVLSLLARGYTRNEIATALGVTPNTAAGHLKSVYRKLQVSGRAEATLEAVRLGVVKVGN